MTRLLKRAVLLALPHWAAAYKCGNFTQGKCSLEGLSTLGTFSTEDLCADACVTKMWDIRTPVCCSYNYPYQSDCRYNPEVTAVAYSSSLTRVAVQCTASTASMTATGTSTITLPTETVTATDTMTATASGTVSVTLPSSTGTASMTFSLPSSTLTASVTATLPSVTGTSTSTLSSTVSTTATMTTTQSASYTMSLPSASVSQTLTVTMPTLSQTLTQTLPTVTLTATLPTLTATVTSTLSETASATQSTTATLPSATSTSTASLPTATTTGTYEAPLHTYEIVKQGYQCLSSDISMGTTTTPEQCAEQCALRQYCQYFVHGFWTQTYGDQTSVCRWELTTSESCSEGWSADSFHFYKITREPQQCPDGAGQWRRLAVSGATLSSTYKETDGKECSATNCADLGGHGLEKDGRMLTPGVAPNGTVCDSYCKTLWQENPWLRLDFAAPATITSVRIWNRDEFATEEDAVAEDQYPGSSYHGVVALVGLNDSNVSQIYFGDRLAPNYEIQVASDPWEGRTEGWDSSGWEMCANRSVDAGGYLRTSAGPFLDRCTASDVRSIRIMLPGSMRQLNLLEVEVFGCPGNWSRSMPWRGSSESHHGAVGWKYHHNRVDRSRDTGYCGANSDQEACQVPVGTECSGAFIRDWSNDGEGVFHLCGGHGTCLVIGGDDFGGQWRPIECSGKYCGGYMDARGCNGDERCFWDTSLDTPACAEAACGAGRLPTSTCVCDHGYELRFVGSRHVSCAQLQAMPGLPGYHAYKNGEEGGLPGYRSSQDTAYPYGAT